MARALKKVGTVLGAVALVATGIGAFAVAGAGIAGIGTFAAIGATAGLAAGIANIGSMALAKPPPARGSLSQILIQADAPAPYVMGEGYFAGVLRHDTGYGGTVDKVENPYRFLPIVYSVAGPVQSISPRVDYGTVPSWYSGFLYTDTQLGACPESNALAPQWAGAVGWTSSSKLSGQAAIGWSLRFDKAGKRFAGGVPLLGAYGQWVKVYDPRLDSTVPGGSGSHRLGTESTYSYSANPALHAGMYAYGRYQNGKRVFGIGLPADAIDWASVSAWANVCDANGWTLFGVAYEPGDRAQNLIDICAAGSGEPCFVNAVLSFRYDAPAVALDTITEADLADEPVSVTFMQSYRNRLNTIIPKYRSPSHNWEMVAAAAVQVSGYVSEDGEERREEWPFNFVKGVNQAAQLAAYRLVNSRELHPIMIPCGPRLRGYGPGDCLHIDLPQSGLDHNAIILEREFDPATMTTRLTLISETGAKHAFALGQTGTAPPTPALVQSSEERDSTAANAADGQVVVEVLPMQSFAADQTGAVTSGLPAYIVPEVTLGSQSVRLADFVSYTIDTNGVTATVENANGDPNKGTIEITDIEALSGYIDLTVTVDGVARAPKRIVIQKVTGLPTGMGGPGSKVAADNSFPLVNSASYVDLTDVLTVTLAAGESLYGSAPLDFWVSGTTALNRTATARWRYSPAGAGTWNNFDGGPIVGGTATGGYFGSLGHGNFNDVKAGLSAGDYDVKLEVLLDVAGVNVGFSGTATIEAKI